MDLNTAINDFQTLLYKGLTSLETGGLPWLNDVCVELTTICRYLHKFLIFDSKANDKVIQTCFLCLNQMMCCIKYLERTLKKELKMKIVLAPTRQHFLDRLVWCLSRLRAAIVMADENTASPSTSDADPSFVGYMDMVLELLSPLSLYSPMPQQKLNVSEQKAEYMRESVKIRTIIECLISQTLTFANVVTNNERVALTTLSQKVMRECIAFQEECSLSKPQKHPNEQDKRVLAQVLENALFNLDKLVNDSLLHTVYELFIKLDQNPIKKLRQLGPMHDNIADQAVIDEEIERFDIVLDQLTQVGTFAVSYASTAKLKSNLRSCLASCEAVDSCLIPSIFSNHSEIHSNILEQHWWEEITYFRRCVQEIIDTDAFCLSLIDTMSDDIKQLTNTFDIDLVQQILRQCNIFHEHLQFNYLELKLHVESPAKLYYDDFKLMLNECKAIVEQRTEQIGNERIIKRLRILRSVIKKLEKTINQKDVTEASEDDKGKSFTFGNVTGTSREQLEDYKITDSMVVAIDLEEFVRGFADGPDASGTVIDNGQILNRSNVFYQSSRRRNRSRMMSSKASNLSPNLKRDINGPKRSSKRTSLRVAMFKRQKSLETQRFFGSLMSDSGDTMNLQITDILEQLSNLSGSLSNKCVAPN